MANSASKFNRFIQANNITKGVVHHVQLNKNIVVALPECAISMGTANIVSKAINNVGLSVSVMISGNDYSRQVAKILELNGVSFVFGNTAPRGGAHGKAIAVTALPEVLNYDASIKY